MRAAIKLLVAGVLLAALYRAVEWHAVFEALGSLDGPLLWAAVALFVPQTIVSALRWRALVAPLTSISRLDAIRHTLAASAWNLIVPSKLGDLSKAAWLTDLDARGKAAAAGLVVAEKLADLAALAVLCGAGWIGVDRPIVGAGLLAGCLALGWMWRAGATRRHRPWAVLAAWSLPLWVLHVTQIGLVLLAAGAQTTCFDISLRVPLAIVAGLVPLSWCGLGFRDAALVALFAGAAPPATLAAVGLLTLARYLVPGAVGIPLVRTAPPVGTTVPFSRGPSQPEIAAPPPRYREAAARPVPRPVEFDCLAALGNRTPPPANPPSTPARHRAAMPPSQSPAVS